MTAAVPPPPPSIVDHRPIPGVPAPVPATAQLLPTTTSSHVFTPNTNVPMPPRAHRSPDVHQQHFILGVRQSPITEQQPLQHPPFNGGAPPPQQHCAGADELHTTAPLQGVNLNSPAAAAGEESSASSSGTSGTPVWGVPEKSEPVEGAEPWKKVTTSRGFEFLYNPKTGKSTSQVPTELGHLVTLAVPLSKPTVHVTATPLVHPSLPLGWPHIADQLHPSPLSAQQHMHPAPHSAQQHMHPAPHSAQQHMH
eukprot:Lankesteria_metandrocarpae@DN1175_c0_g1_i1.p1